MEGEMVSEAELALSAWFQQIEYDPRRVSVTEGATTGRNIPGTE